MLIPSGGRTVTVTEVEPLSLPPLLRTVSETVLVPVELHDGRYVEPLPDDAPDDLHEYETPLPVTLARHLVLSPVWTVESSQVTLLITGGGTTSTRVEELAFPTALLTVSETVLRPAELQLGE